MVPPWWHNRSPYLAAYSEPILHKYEVIIILLVNASGEQRRLAEPTLVQPSGAHGHFVQWCGRCTANQQAATRRLQGPRRQINNVGGGMGERQGRPGGATNSTSKPHVRDFGRRPPVFCFSFCTRWTDARWRFPSLRSLRCRARRGGKDTPVAPRTPKPPRRCAKRVQSFLLLP